MYVGHAAVKIARVKVTQKSLIKKIRGKEVEKGIEKSGLLQRPAVAVGEETNIFLIELIIKNEKLYSIYFYYSHFTVLLIVAQDHRPQAVEAVPDQALLQVLPLPVQQVLLEVLEIGEENEAEARV